jgi:hypothetical protein
MHSSWWKAVGEILLAWCLYGVTHLSQVLMIVQIIAGLATVVFTVVRTVIALRDPRRPVHGRGTAPRWRR